VDSEAPTVVLTDWIDYRELPAAAGGFSQLFFDYLYDYQKVQKYYRQNFRESHSFESVIKAIDTRPLDRATLTRVLTEQNTAFGSPPLSLENVALLSKPTTYGVVTGQQVGLFGGPLYTVYKTITAIKLADKLKLKYPQYDFVPVFWLEGEDHDFAEMNNISLLDPENKTIKIEYLPGGESPERNLGAIGELAFDGSLETSFAALESTLQKSEFTQDLLKKLKACYTSGRTFTQAFTAWMNMLFGGYGLVFISSPHPELKRLLTPLFVKEVSEYPRTSQMVIAQSAELEERYHAQIKAKSINLFLFHKGGRYLIEPREHDFSLKGTRHFLQKEELLKIAQETPELLSPNVILRPFAQDTLLPTVAYVAGPSEVAYHAQLTPVYEYLNIPQPVVFPRASCSYVGGKLQRTMDKYGLELLQFFGDTNELTARVVEQIAEVKLDHVFGNVQKHVHDALNELTFGLNEVDPTLLGALEGVKSKIDINVSVLKEKAVGAQKRRNETAVRQIESAVAGLLPNGGLQEREISILYYLNKYGPDLIQWLMGEIDITGFKHQILKL
jgi:bacillithiol synthase